MIKQNITQTTPQKLVGIYGGSFDPPHFGHLRPALEIVERLNLGQLRFIPSALPPHKDKPCASAALRLQMLSTAIEGEHRFMLDDREIRRKRISYTIDTIVDLRRELGNKPLALLMGADAFAGFHHWYQWRQISRYTHIIVTRRPGSINWKEYHQQTIDPQLKQFITQHQVSDPDCLLQQANGCLYFIEVSQYPISSSLIRQKIRNKQSARYLLPDPVYDIIKAQHIYQE